MYGASAPADVTVGALLAVAALIASWVGGATGCSKYDTTGAGALSFAQKESRAARSAAGMRSSYVDDGGGFQVVWDDNPLPYAGVS